MSRFKTPRWVRQAAFLAAGSLALSLAFVNCNGGVPSSNSSLTSSSSGGFSGGGNKRSFVALNPNEVEMVLQADYSAGVNVVPACRMPGDAECPTGGPRYRLVNPLNPTMNSQTPAWELAQWASTTNLPTNATRNADGSYAYGDLQKSITFFPDGRVQFAVNALSRYNGAYNTDTQAWLGIIAGQTFAAPGPLSHPSGTLAQIQSINFSIDARLMYEQQNIRAGYNQAAHASIFPMYLTIQNLKVGHRDYGKYVWLGIPIYDDRVDFPVEYTEIDVGTQMLIHTPAYSTFATKSMRSKEWVHFEADMLPAAKRAVALALQRGFITDGDLNNFQVGGMNMGFEDSGLNVSTIQVQNLSIRVNNPSLFGAAPVPVNTLAPAARRTLNFTNSNAQFSQTFVANETAANSQSVRIFNTISGRTANARLTLDPVSHAILAVSSVGSPYFCYQPEKTPCELVPVPAAYGNASVPAGSMVQNCYSPVTLSGAFNGNLNGVTTDLSCAAPAPDTPEGFWQIPGEPGVFYSNGKDAFCIFTNYDTYLRWHGGITTVDGYRQLPRNMRNDGVCP